MSNKRKIKVKDNTNEVTIKNWTPEEAEKDLDARTKMAMDSIDALLKNLELSLDVKLDVSEKGILPKLRFTNFKTYNIDGKEVK